MKNFTRLGTVSVAAALLSTTAFAEGLERSNLSTSILYESGTYVEAAYGAVTPDLPANGASPFALSSPDLDVAGDFNAVSLGFKMDATDRLSLALTYTSQGNGVNIDWGTITAVTTESFEISADIDFSTLALLAKYEITDNIAVIGGAKYVSTDGGSLAIGADTNMNLIPDTTLAWDAESASGFGYVVGLSYEIPDIALRAVLTYESSIDLDNQANATAGAPIAATGEGQLSIGDAWNLAFQSGIAQNTLLFGNIRYSMWEDNQTAVPVAGAALQQVSDYEDGYSYTLGVARRLNEQWALSASVFYDPGDGDGASELAPQGSNRSLTLGARYTAPSGFNIQFGGTYSTRGDATTGNIAAELDESVVTSLGLKLSKNF